MGRSVAVEGRQPEGVERTVEVARRSGERATDASSDRVTEPATADESASGHASVATAEPTGIWDRA